jgi:pyruvate kinase
MVDSRCRPGRAGKTISCDNRANEATPPIRFHNRLATLATNARVAAKRTAAMPLPAHKTKIVATIGPASQSPEMLERLIRAGLNVARLNFSHGDFAGHGEVIERIRAVSKKTGLRVAIMADLPGPKMRLGKIDPEPIVLEIGAPFILTSEDIVGDSRRVSMTFEPLPRVVKPGHRLYLNDGLSQLIVERVEGNDVICTVAVGGELRSRKGLNLPRIELGISAFTKHDYDCLKFALENGVDAVSQSFVESAADIAAVRTAARELGYNPFLIAKIERAESVERFDEILAESDGIMVARGDLGVEIPIEEIAILQKQLIAKANLAGKPVITATQMLESMTATRLPTRAETTDVANAILDGTDCVMLSAESAMGKYPVEAVEMLGRIAAFTEANRCGDFLQQQRQKFRAAASAHDLTTRFLEAALEATPCDAVVAPTHSGATARAVARFRLSVWTVAFTTHPVVAQNLAFTCGVFPVDIAAYPDDWRETIQETLRGLGLNIRDVLLITGPSEQHPDANRRLELLAFADGENTPA